MITFNGIKNKGKSSYIVFKNEQGNQVEIPIDRPTAERVSKYLSKIVMVDEKKVERGNDEDAD